MTQTLTESRPAAGMRRGPVLVLARLAPPEIAQALDAEYACLNAFEAPDLEALIAEHGHSIRALVTTGGHGADARLIKRLPVLEAITVYGVGAVDLDCAASRGIVVTNTPDVLTEDVANHALALYLSALRLVTAGDRAIRAGGWDVGLAMPRSARPHPCNNPPIAGAAGMCVTVNLHEPQRKLLDRYAWGRWPISRDGTV